MDHEFHPRNCGCASCVASGLDPDPRDPTNVEPPYELVTLFYDGREDLHDFYGLRDNALAAFGRACARYPEGIGKTVDLILYCNVGDESGEIAACIS